MSRYSVVYGKGDTQECGLESSFCTNPFCDHPCDCGFTFDEAKEYVVRFYQEKIKHLNTLSEEDWENY